MSLTEAAFQRQVTDLAELRGRAEWFGYSFRRDMPPTNRGFIERWQHLRAALRADPALQATGEPHPFRDRSLVSISCAECGEEPVHSNHRGYRTADRVRAGATGEPPHE